MQIADSQIEQVSEASRPVEELFLVLLGTLPDLRIVVDQEKRDQAIAIVEDNREE